MKLRLKNPFVSVSIWFQPPLCHFSGFVLNKHNIHHSWYTLPSVRMLCFFNFRWLPENINPEWLLAFIICRLLGIQLWKIAFLSLSLSCQSFRICAQSISILSEYDIYFHHIPFFKSHGIQSVEWMEGEPKSIDLLGTQQMVLQRQHRMKIESMRECITVV